MATCICDGPPHSYSASWCHAGRNAAPPHGPINPYWSIGADAPWDNTAYDRARDADIRGSIPRNHGGVGHSPTETPTYGGKQELARNVAYLRKTAKEYQDEGLLDEADRLSRIADFLEGITT